MRRILPGLVAMLVIAVVLAVAVWQSPNHRFATREPVGIMGTSCQLAADAAHGEVALDAAEGSLRRAEAALSAKLEASAVGRINAAGDGARIPLSSDVLAVIGLAHAAVKDTDGVFDATLKPILEAWRTAGKAGRVPDATILAAARAASTWEDFTIEEQTLVKRRASARLDLGGVAKGWAVDQAITAMRTAGAHAGMVDAGGDLRVFGPGNHDGAWEILVASPSGRGICAKLAVKDRAVCTSGNYCRFTEIQGRRYSHIVDPRNQQPADVVPSVTVIAADCTTADIWATALSILGTEGLRRLPAGVEAMLILDAHDAKRIVFSPAFRGFLTAGPCLPTLPETP